MRRMRTFLSLAGTTALAAGLATVPAAAVAATPVACDSGQLVNAVATAPAGSTLDLAPGCLYTLTTPYSATTALPPVDRTLVVNGNGATIARTGPGPSRIFEVTSTGHLTLNNLTIRTDTTTTGSSQSSGGAIHSEGGLVLHGVTIISTTSSGNGLLVVGNGGTVTGSGGTVTGSAGVAANVGAGSGTFDVGSSVGPSVPDVDTTVTVPGVSLVGIGGVKALGLAHLGPLGLSLSPVTGNSTTVGPGGLHNSVTVINSSGAVAGDSAVSCADIPGPVPGCAA